MMKKDFVSIFFTREKVQILHLNPQKEAVKGFTSVNLPKKLIANSKIQDCNVMSSLISKAWQSLGLEEKSVGIILPEFSTFTKSMILPKLDPKELDEAVRWRFKDFWPSGDKHMIMDWKITQKNEDNYQVLAVSVPRDVLQSFVNPIAQAGLFPVLIETPSLSLVRISDGMPTGKLIIYANFDGAVLALAKGEEIFGSSVLNTVDQNNILWTAQQMVKHYSKISIDRIEVGGLQFSQELLNGLSQTMNKPINWIQVSIEGLSVQQIQEYLVPISLQFKNPAEPRDETTVNLLPLKWVNYYENKKLKAQSFGLIVVSSVIIWICLLAALGAYFFLYRQVEVFKKSGVAQILELPPEIKGEIDKINSITAKVSKVADISQSPQEIINLINKAKPSGITLFGYQLDFDSGKAVIKGRADNRQLLIDFKKDLEDKSKFTKTSIPLSVLEQNKNLDFEISFIFRPAEKKGTIKVPIK